MDWQCRSPSDTQVKSVSADALAITTKPSQVCVCRWSDNAGPTNDTQVKSVSADALAITNKPSHICVCSWIDNVGQLVTSKSNLCLQMPWVTRKSNPCLQMPLQSPLSQVIFVSADGLTLHHLLWWHYNELPSFHLVVQSHKLLWWKITAGSYSGGLESVQKS